VNEYTWLATTVAAVGVIVTVTTFALELPQPATHAVAHNAAATAASFIIRNFILTSPPLHFSWRSTTLSCSISMPSSRSPLSHFLLQSLQRLCFPGTFVLNGAKIRTLRQLESLSNREPERARRFKVIQTPRILNRRLQLIQNCWVALIWM
jgi:hypothetical protein